MRPSTQKPRCRLFLLACGGVGVAAADCTVPQDALSVAMPVAGASASTSPAPAAGAPSGCYGDSPPEVIAKDARPRDLFATGQDVLWTSGGVVHRLAATGPVAVVNSTPGTAFLFIKAADARGAYGPNGQLAIVGLDLSTGHSRVLNQSWPAGSAKRNLPAVVTLWGAEYALDADYVYVASRGDPATYGFYSQGDHARSLQGSHDIGDLTRVRRDGSSPPEYLGKGPDGRFLVWDGYAYWGARYEGVKRRRLVPGAENEVIWPGPDVPIFWPIGIVAGRFYFSTFESSGSQRSFAVESVPIAPADGGSSPRRIHATALSVRLIDAVVDGSCVYSATGAGVTRVHLEDGRVETMMDGHPVAGDATISGSRFIATDGRFLYWADYGGDPVVRWKR